MLRQIERLCRAIFKVLQSTGGREISSQFLYVLIRWFDYGLRGVDGDLRCVTVFGLMHKSRAMRLIMLLAPLLISACSAQSDETSAPCQEDRFFCDTPELRMKALQGLSDRRLIEVTRINYKHYRPPSDAFPKEIGKRGEKGKRIVLELARYDEPFTVAMLTDALRSLRDEAHIDMCGGNETSKRQKMREACNNLSNLAGLMR